MADIRTPASEQLRKVALEERERKLIPINEYKPVSSEYGANHKNALSDFVFVAPPVVIVFLLSKYSNIYSLLLR